MASKLQRISLASVTHNDGGHYCVASHAQGIIDELEKDNKRLRDGLVEAVSKNTRMWTSNAKLYRKTVELEEDIRWLEQKAMQDREWMDAIIGRHNFLAGPL